MDNYVFCHLTVEKQNECFGKTHFSKFPCISYPKFRIYIFSYIGSPKVDMCYSDFLLADKQIECFGPNPLSHFLLAEKQIEPLVKFSIPFHSPAINGCFHPTRLRFDPGCY